MRDTRPVPIQGLFEVVRGGVASNLFAADTRSDFDQPESLLARGPRKNAEIGDQQIDAFQSGQWQLAARLDRSPKPLRRLKSNAAPMLFPAEDAPESCKGLKHGLKELERREVLVDYRPGAGIRVAPHFYSTDEDVERTVAEIREIL